MATETLVFEAKEALRAREYAKSLPLWDAAIEEDPKNAQLWMYRGICLAHMGRRRDATDSLANAAELEPTNPQILANLAVHQYETGLRKEARVSALAALQYDPNDAQAREVIARTDDSALVTTPAQKEPQWSQLGIAFIVFGFAVTVLNLARPPVTFPTAQNPSVPKGDVTSFIQIFLWACAGLGCGWWMLVDMIHRKARFAWIVPQLIFCACGVPAAPMLIYFVIGRK